MKSRPTRGWRKNVLWQRLLLSFAQARYQEMVSNRNYGGYVRDNRASVDTSVARQIGVENTGAAALPMVVVGVFILLAGFGGYWLLKRLDPARVDVGHGARDGGCGLAVAVGLSQVLPLREPAATYYTVLHVDENGHQDGYNRRHGRQGRTRILTVGATNGQGRSARQQFPTIPTATPSPWKIPPSCAIYAPMAPPRPSPIPKTVRGTGFSLVVRDAPTEEMGGVSGGCRWEGTAWCSA